MQRLCRFAISLALGIGCTIVGGVYGVGAATQPSSSTISDAVITQVITTAQTHLRDHYARIGDTPKTGFSCIGFVHYVYALSGIYVPEELSRAFASAPHITSQSDLLPGDLVFFKDTVWPGISHVALYVGKGQMIAADDFQVGVTWDTLSDPYWQEHFLGITRPRENPSGTLLDPNAVLLPAGPSLAPPSGPTLHLKAGSWLLPQQTSFVYSGPGLTYSLIDSVTPSTSVQVVQTQGEWVNVAYAQGTQFGWVQGANLAVGGALSAHGQPSSATTTPTATATMIPATPTPTVTTAPSATSTAIPTATPAISYPAGNQVVATATTLYSGPTSSDYPVDQIAAGTTVIVLQGQDGWVRIRLSDQTEGWLPLNTLKVTQGLQPHLHLSSGSSTATTTHTGRHVITAGVLFVRSTPSLHGKILRRVHRGDRVTILSQRHGWAYIMLRDASRGWVLRSWVK